MQTSDHYSASDLGRQHFCNISGKLLQNDDHSKGERDSFWSSYSLQKQSPRGVIKKTIEKFTGKHLHRSLFFNKVAGLRSFPMNFEKSLITKIFIKHLWWLLLSLV